MATTRTTVILPEHEREALQGLADRRGIAFTHALRQAIQSELYIQSLVDQGAKLLVQGSDGNLQQLVFTQAAQSRPQSPQLAGAGPAAVA